MNTRRPVSRLVWSALAAGCLVGCGHGGSKPAVDVAATLESAPPTATARLEVVPAELLAADPVATDSTDAATLSRLGELAFRSGRPADGVHLLAPYRAEWQAVLEGRSGAWSRGEAWTLLAGQTLNAAAAGEAGAIESGSRWLAADTADSPVAASLLAYLELKGDDTSRAISAAERAWRADSTNAVRLNNYGITRLQQGDVPSAERAFRAALHRAPDLPGPYYNMAILSAFYRMNKQEGRHWFAQYRNRATEDPDHLESVLAAAGADSTGGEKQ